MCLKTTNTAIYSEIHTLCGRIYLADSNKINKQPTSTSKLKNSEREKSARCYKILLAFDKKYENIAKIPGLLNLFYRKHSTL